MISTPDGYHCPRLVLGNLASWVHASTIVYASETYNARAILDTLEAEKCTGVHGVPTHFLGLLDEIDKEAHQEGGKWWNLTTLRTGIAAGTTIPMDLMRRLIDKLKLRDLTIAYGMS